jgi:heterodisulfide reductase subunit A
MKSTCDRDVLVVGGGIAGMQSALLLAEMGYRIALLENGPAIGGYFPLLDRTFPTNSCGVCFMKPTPPAYCPIYESELHENIELMPNCDLEALDGEPGRFEVSINQRPRFVDGTTCTHCDRCAEVCPVEVPSEFGGGLERRKAIYLPVPQAIPRSYVIDPETCTRCGECVKVCGPQAIHLDEEPVNRRMSVAGVILSPGFEPFRAGIKGEYGFGRYTNVLNSIQYERMLSFSSPTRGLPSRRSDEKPPRRIAFIQCVGSRDPSCGQYHCSTICCMYATKQAMVSKDRVEGLEVTVFYIDIRPMGKDYERYYETAQNRYGIHYRKSAISAIRELQQSKNLLITYGLEDGAFRDEEFDMVVLSVGFTPPVGSRDMADRLGIALNDAGFCKTPEFDPAATSRPGIFVAGAFKSPTDIPETVVEASSAAANAACLLARLDMETQEETIGPTLGGVGWTIPKVGVFLCPAGDEISEVLNLDEIAEAMKMERDVVHVEEVPVVPLDAGLGQIRNRMGEKEINRVVIAGSSLMELGRGVEKMARGAGLSPHVFEYANIGEQCAYVHSNDSRLATEKAKVLIRSAVARARWLNPLKEAGKEVASKALVVGAGLSGLSAAVSLAEQGIDVVLLEKEDDLGGNASQSFYTLNGSDPQGFLRDLIGRVEAHPRVTIWKRAEIESFSGHWGDFRTRVSVDGEMRELTHGAVILATGAHETRPKEYLYGEEPGVITQRELERMVHEDDTRLDGLKSVVMIQCVGSRDEEHPYCSRICCGHAVKNALKLKEKSEELSIIVLYRDVRTYGFSEIAYQEARNRGVIFVRYEPHDKPRVTSDHGTLTVRFTDPVVGQELELNPDLLVLSAGIESNDNRKLGENVGIGVNRDGFFQEANPKSAPLDAVDRGKFFCGLCHSPSTIEDAISQANGAAIRGAVLLRSQKVEYKPYLAYVIERLCCGCGLCVTTCPYGARVLNEETWKARVLEDLCQGCGSCVIACRNGASQQLNYEKATVLATLDAAID